MVTHRGRRRRRHRVALLGHVLGLLAARPSFLSLGPPHSVSASETTCACDGSGSSSQAACGDREDWSATGPACPSFTALDPPRDLAVRVHGAHHLTLSWHCHTCNLTENRAGLKFRVRLSRDRYFEEIMTRMHTTAPGLDTANITIFTGGDGTYAVDKQRAAPLWSKHLFMQVQLYKETDSLGGKWSQTSAEWLLAKDCNRFDDDRFSTGVAAKKDENKGENGMAHGEGGITWRGYSGSHLLDQALILDNRPDDVKDWRCVPIPQGGYASAESTYRTLMPVAGYTLIEWARDDPKYVDNPFEKCPHEHDCVGVGHVEWPENKTIGCQQNYSQALCSGSCLNGAGGTLCAVCINNYNREGGRCRSCDDTSMYIRIGLGIIVLITPVFLIATFWERIKEFCECAVCLSVIKISPFYPCFWS